MGNKGSKEKKGADAHAPNEVAAAAHDDEPRPRASLEIVKPPATPADQGEHAPNDAPKSPEVAERPMTAEEKKAARKSVKIEKEKEKEKEKQERKRKEKEEKAMKEAEKRMAASAKSRKSVKSKEELRQESHEKVADVMAFLNDVEKKKTEGKEEDAIAMLDDLIAEDNQAKQPEPAPVTEAPPAQEGPRDLVALLEKLQQLIEDPVMLQRLEELLGQKLTSEDDATKLKKLSDAEMERINTVLAQDNQWTQQRRAEREAEKKALTERVNLADKRKSYMAPSAKDQHAAGSGSGSLDVPVTTGSVKRRSMQLNASATGPGSLKKQSEADHAAGGAARTTGPGSLKKSNNVGAAAASPAGAAHTGPGSLRKNDAVAAPTVAPASAAAEPTAAQPASPAPAAAPAAPVAVATTPTITVASPGPVTELRSAMKKGDSATKSRRGVKMQVEGEEEEVRKTPSGKRIVIEGRNKIIERIDDGGAAASGKKEQEHKRASGKSVATAEKKDEAKVATPGPAKEAEKSKEDSGKHLHHSGKDKKDEEHKRGSVKRAEKENKHDDKNDKANTNDKKEEDKHDKDAKEEAPAPAKPSSKKRIVIAEEEEEEPAVSEEAKAKKEAESQAKLAAYKKELEERKRKSNAEARRKAMEKLEAESK